MDSITQATLGAAVGEAVLGKKIGNKAIILGAIAGTIPDLDVMFSPLMDAVNQLAFHRGVSHSIFFIAIAPFLFSWLSGLIFKKSELKFKSWYLMYFLAFITHVAIDLFTSYGTQILAPITKYGFTTNNISIIDPIYTLPMLFAIIITLFFKRDKKIRRTINYTGLSISTFYIILTFIFKVITSANFDSVIQENKIIIEEDFNTPSLANTLLWNYYGISGDAVYVQISSILDDENDDTNLQKIERNTHFIENHLNDRAIKRLFWFSKGYYTIQKIDSDLYFFDIRFGRTDFWMENDGNYIFSFKLVKENGKYNSFERTSPNFNARERLFSDFLNRMLSK